MSGLFSAVGRGLSSAGYAAGEMFAKGALMDQQSAQETERQQRLLEFREQMEIRAEQRKTEASDKARVDQTKRIDAKAGELADQAVGEKRGLIDAGIADRSLWTAEQQAAVDQSLAGDRKDIAADSETRTKAAIATGDISPKEAAVIERDERRLTMQEKAAADKAKADERKDATARYIADLRDKQQSARLEALIAKMGKGENPTKQALNYIGELRKELTSESQNIRQLMQSELKDVVDPDERKEIMGRYQPKLDAIERQRSQIGKDFNALRSQVGLPATAEEPAPKPAPKADRPPLSSFMKK